MTERVDKAESVRNFYRRQGVVMERERIIALLEESVHVYLLEKLLVEAAILENAIALIKGETK